MVANHEIQKQRELKKQQEIVEDLKILEYQKEKAKREAEYEAEQEKKKIEKEKEVARLRSLQERAKDLQAEKDALRAKREQERKEREWREKERQIALKKKNTEEEMRLARQWQIKNKEHYSAIEAAKDRVEFQKVLRLNNFYLNEINSSRRSFSSSLFFYLFIYFLFFESNRNQIDMAEKEKLEEEKALKKQKAHIKSLQTQIRENELQRMEERKTFFEEGARIEQQARLKAARLEEIKRKKLNELR
jgi:hypothetical protein